METLVVAGVEIDRCTACLGLFLDAGEASMLLARQAVSDSDSVTMSLLPDIMDEIQAKCPRCEVMMERCELPSEMVIDKCPKCQAHFFDQGELVITEFEGGMKG